MTALSTRLSRLHRDLTNATAEVATVLPASPPEQDLLTPSVVTPLRSSTRHDVLLRLSCVVLSRPVRRRSPWIRLRVYCPRRRARPSPCCQTQRRAHLRSSPRFSRYPQKVALITLTPTFAHNITQGFLLDAKARRLRKAEYVADCLNRLCWAVWSP